MTKKRVLMPIVTFTLAAAAAVGSVFADQNVFVHARLTDITGVIRCVNTNVSCDDTGSSICTVVVPVLNGAGTQTATTNGSSGFVAYKTGCATALRSKSSVALNASPTFQVYELIFP
jgi:hypothetical protein